MTSTTCKPEGDGVMRHPPRLWPTESVYMPKWCGYQRIKLLNAVYKVQDDGVSDKAYLFKCIPMCVSSLKQMNGVMEMDSDVHMQIPEVLVSWKVNNFSLFKQHVVGFRVTKTFSVQGKDNCTWDIHLYPFGRTEIDKNYISIYFEYTVSKTSDIPSLLKFSFNDKNGKCLVASKESSIYSTELKYTLGCILCERKKILDLLKDDLLDVTCWIQWKTCISNGNSIGALDEFDRMIKLSSDYKKLLNDSSRGRFSDVLLVANDGIEFPVYKGILASRSPVFSAMFTHDMKENKESRIDIEDFDGKTLKAMLDFIYTGNFDEDGCEISNLFVVADKYAIDNLKNWCEHKLIKSLKVDNAITYLVLSDKCNSMNLKDELLKFIVVHINDVLKTNSFKNLKFVQPHLLEEILEKVVKSI
ncbi:speckle-type POZ protein-like [Copidosoma floridanum]|uniref:speckle-type POZ protein-like n=1 Tax=Copidosoma floridanum TaxID=29053 RepID=UPI0006C9BACD|nr:speckle-type POZ protein-like [Copidosoma floridanum]